MDETLDRRNAQRERLPLLSAELGHGDFEDPFAADVLNLSKGGVSMRAACLPDLGSRLSCRFRCSPSGALICAEGEVVWAHLDGEQSGEFGLAFVDLDPQTEWMIEELLAEQVACAGGSTPKTEVFARVATLELEGSSDPIDARLASDGEDVAVFEQALELLSVGRGVRAHTRGIGGRAGSIAAVELRMVGSVPMLAVTVEFADASVAGEVAAATPEPPRAAEEALAHDTEPDLHAPEAGTDDELDELLAPPPAEPMVTASVAAPRDPAREHSRAFALPKREARPLAAVADEPDQLDLEFEAMVRPSWRPALDRALAMLASAGAALSSLIGSRVARSAVPLARGGLLRAASFTRALYGRTLATQLGTLRRVLPALIAGRRRRTTSGRGQERGAASLARTALVGLLGAGAAGFAVYALMPSEGDRIELHRSVRAQPSASESLLPASSAAPASAVAAPATLGKSAAPDPRAVPSAAAVPAGSPFAVDVRGARPAEQKAGASGKQLRFGAANVPKPRRYALRMSTKVQNLSGVADAGGFTITVLGSLSLDRAGPIASSHKSVARAMIINRGDRSELSIRFVDGKRPAYQVTAEGATLIVVIEDT